MSGVKAGFLITNQQRHGTDMVSALEEQFVMVRLDKDKNAELSKRYAPDGEYIPRTYFLASDGKLDPSIHAPRDQYKYFYNESDPSSVLAGMDAALAKLK